MPTQLNTDEHLVIACDESGNDGENNLNGNSTVFVHASVAISSDVAQGLMEEVRARTRSRSAELKSKTLLQPKHKGTARWLLEHPELLDKCSLVFIHKQYFTVSKLFDSTAEEAAHSLNEDMYENGGALSGANLLYFLASEAFGAGWFEVLDSFETFLRAETAEVSSQRLNELATRIWRILETTKSPLRDVLGVVFVGITHLLDLSKLQLGEGIEDRLRTADPLIAAIGATIHEWTIKSRRPIAMVHDDAKTLTPSRIDLLKDSLWRPERVAASRAGTGSELVGITHVDSRSDSRVQVADLLAGLGRAVAEAVAEGDSHPLLQYVDPMQNRFSIWPVHEHMDPQKARATMTESHQLLVGEGQDF